MFSAFLVIFGILFIAYSYSYSAGGDLTGRSGRIYRIFTVFLGAAMVIVLFLGGVSGFTTRLWDYGIIPPVLFPLFFAFPAFLTCINVVTLIQNRTEKTAVTDLMTISIGGIMWYILVGISMEIYEKPWYEPVYPNGYHEFLSSDYRSNIVLLTVLGLVSLAVLSALNGRKLPPLVSALLTALTAVGLALFTMVNVQLLKNFRPIHIMLWLYVLDLYLVAARRVRQSIESQVRRARERQTQFRSKASERLHKLMTRVSGMTALSFLLILPVVLVFEVMYIIFGQGADGFIKAFTETADWTFSQQTPPPPVDYEGHYLCTVAAGGHRKVVKPLRFGIRRGERIVVNRQLLTANAFEDMIKERFPGFHRAVRSFYDKHGYPISRHIKTQLRADIVYVLMKPLELIFITALYLFDTEPENRIAVQYSEYKGRNG